MSTDLVVVTGASGTVGTEVLRALKEKGVAVRAVTRSRPPSVEGVEHRRADLESGQGLSEALEGGRKLFLLGGEIPDQAGVEIRTVMAAKQAGFDRVVKLSVLYADQESYSFARIHRRVEIGIQESGLKWTFLRPNAFMQNFVNMYRQEILQTGGISFSAGDAKVSQVDVRDIGDAAAAVLTSDGHEGVAYDLTGPEGLSYGEAAKLLAEAAGRPIEYRSISDEEFHKGAVGAGLPEWIVKDLVDLFRFYRTNQAAYVSNDTQKLLGRPARSFKAFAQEYGNMFVSEK